MRIIYYFSGKEKIRKKTLLKQDKHFPMRNSDPNNLIFYRGKDRLENRIFTINKKCNRLFIKIIRNIIINILENNDIRFIPYK